MNQQPSPPTQRLRGKTALVTGGASGIGLATALRFAAEGAMTFVADIDETAARRVASRAPVGIIHGLHMDVRTEESVEAAYARIALDSPGLDVVVASAGIQLFGRDAPAHDLARAEWDATIETNLTGTFLTVKHAIRSMLGRGGSIIIVGSPTGLSGEGSETTAYAVSKAAVHGLARTVAAEYGPHGIRANVVVPGFTETALTASVSADPVVRASIVRRIPLGRAGRPEDVAGVMVHLAGDESAYSTGGLFMVDGGLVL